MIKLVKNSKNTYKINPPYYTTTIKYGKKIIHKFNHKRDILIELTNSTKKLQVKHLVVYVIKHMFNTPDIIKGALNIIVDYDMNIIESNETIKTMEFLQRIDVDLYDIYSEFLDNSVIN